MRILVYPCYDAVSKSVCTDIGTLDLIRSDFPEKKIDCVFDWGPIYGTYPFNEHHYVVGWQQTVIAKTVLEMFGIRFCLSDFEFKPYYVRDRNYIYDLSYYMFRGEQSYTIVDAETGSVVRKPDLYRDMHDNFLIQDRSVTEYHRLLWCTHKCALIINNNLPEGKTVLISCDSQMVPVISVIAPYFREILYLDRRGGYDVSGLTGRDYDHVLFAHWCKTDSIKDMYDRKMKINFGIV